MVANCAAAQASPQSAPSAAHIATGRVIVMLRNQHTNLAISKGRSSARMNANRTEQAPLLSAAKSAGAKSLHGFSSINAFSATVTAAQAKRLAANPDVAGIYPDLAISAAPLATAPTAKVKAAAVAPTPGDGTMCPSDPAKPLLEPQALGLTNTAFTNPATPQAQNIVDGTGVKVAFIADGVDINNPDFIRADGTHVFTDYQDFSGDGPNAPTGGEEAFGDASAIAAQGRQVYDLSQYVNAAHPLPVGCNITVRGVAPGASLVGLKVFGDANTAPTSRFIEAIDYAVTDGVDVLNESFGGNPFPDNGNDPITLADKAAVAAGVTVVASTGDAGSNGTIGSPASSGAIIGVGATTMFQSYAQQDYAGFDLSNGTWLDNNISGLSSGGTTQAGGVPDLVAPGDLGWALCSTDTDTYSECTNDNGAPSPIQDFGGTSQSSPLTAGAAALVIEAYENTHHGVRPTPALVKSLLTSTATDLGSPASEQGSGLLNSLAAVQAAESWQDGNGSPAAQGSALVTDKSQLMLSGNPGNSRPATISVKNVSGTTQTVKGATRSFENTVSTVNGTATLNTATAPVYVDAFDIRRSYVEQDFTVGTADRLDVSAAANTGNFLDRITLVDPSGAYAAYGIPQGGGNFAHVDVRLPKAGTWRAYFAISQSSGYNGPIAYQVVQTDFTTHGTVTPSKIVLAPGASGTFTVHPKVPTSPGDLSASVQFTASGGATTSVPMTLRAQIPPYHNTFSGTITGGNGRAIGGVAQSNIYAVNVPSGKKSLSIGITLSDPDEVVLATFTAPDGQVYSFESNVSNDQTQLENGLQIDRRNPTAGIWTLSLEVTNPVSGFEVDQSFTVTTNYNVGNITASLPNSASKKLTAGTAVTVPVSVKNTGVVPVTYFADPRLTTVGTIPLAELSGNSTVPLPVPAGTTPFWLVPTETTQLNASATADQPVNMDLYYESGEPDVYSAANGNGASVQVNAAQVSPGIWETDLGQTGPFSGPAPAGSATVSASAVGQLFDPAVTSSTGDFWQVGVDPSADSAEAAQIQASHRHLLAGTLAGPSAKATRSNAQAEDAPEFLTLNPGQTGTIMVTITPAGASGTVVSGNVYIDSVDQYTDGGNELAALPYKYTIR